MGPMAEMPSPGYPEQARAMLKDANRIFFASEALKQILADVLERNRSADIHTTTVFDPKRMAKVSVAIADEMVNLLYPSGESDVCTRPPTGVPKPPREAR